MDAGSADEAWRTILTLHIRGLEVEVIKDIVSLFRNPFNGPVSVNIPFDLSIYLSMIDCDLSRLLEFVSMANVAPKALSAQLTRYYTESNEARIVDFTSEGKLVASSLFPPFSLTNFYGLSDEVIVLPSFFVNPALPDPSDPSPDSSSSVQRDIFHGAVSPKAQAEAASVHRLPKGVCSRCWIGTGGLYRRHREEKCLSFTAEGVPLPKSDSSSSNGSNNNNNNRQSQ
jgi:hypothetical protein